MASRIMHYAIADQIAAAIPIQNREKFLLGNLEPDISGKADGSYDRAHFSEENAEKGTKGINWRTFVDKYQENILEDDELLGYLCHLIADACWLKRIRETHIRIFSGEKRKEMNRQGYEEMRRYNPVLIEQYGLRNEIQSMEAIGDFQAEEINPECKEQFLAGLAADFAVEKEPENRFVVYPYAEVMEYMEFCVEKIIAEISALRKKETLSNPEEFYILI